MSDILRPSPRHKPVSLFVTCMVDNLFPNTGIATVNILDHLGIDVDFPAGQTCCGQPAFNAGFWDDARPVATHFLHVFADAELIVTPSGSCASMVAHYYPELFKHEPRLYEKAVRIASITWELSEYLVDGLGITALDASLPATNVAFHHACHGLRLGGIKKQAQTLVESIDGVTVVELPGSEECCGFGGLFSVKMAAVSNAMLQTKLKNVRAAAADVILTGDAGCLAQINGGLERADETAKVVHTAEFIANALVKS